MSYLVLSRKYRPQEFDSVIGQGHITDILKKAIESDKVAHAYLFCGPRGIGKTSCARILAKSLNCDKGPTVKPCGKCHACNDITKGSSFDVLEVDGASNRGIDEIRGLRENVKFAPTYGRYKVYIVDEVHMLTTEAFNALLKTLEEPPPHVIFIFATTAANKVPSTIISRCQKFDFKRISIKDIVSQLTSIIKKEKLKVDQDALYAIAKAAQGSMRDGLSILDQLSALSERNINASDVCSMLGLVEIDLLFSLADALAKKDCSRALRTLEEIIDKGKDVGQLTKDLTEHFRNLMVIKIGGKAMGKLVDYPVAIKDRYLEQCSSLSLKDILDAIDGFISAQESARVTESIRMSLEIAFAKLTYHAGVLPEKSHIAQESDQDYRFSPANAFKSNKGHIDISGKLEDYTEDEVEMNDVDPLGDDALVNELETDERTIVPEPEEEALNVDVDKIRRIWDAVTYAISKEKMSVATFLQSGMPFSLKESRLVIGFPTGCSFQKEFLENSDNVKLVEKIFSDKLKQNIIVQYCISEDCISADEEPDIQKVIEAFNGKVVSKWHEE